MKKELSHKEKSKIAIIVLICMFVIPLVSVSLLTRPSFKQGDYSSHTCIYCSNHATWKLYCAPDTFYYCNNHAESGKSLYERLTGKATSTTSRSETVDGYGHDRFDAIVVAEKIVADKLKSPSTAKFCGNSDYTVTCSDNAWTVEGYVDAQNSFGAILRNDFVVKFTFISSDKYTIDSSDIVAR